jgi:hypothetical protein
MPGRVIVACEALVILGNRDARTARSADPELMPPTRADFKKEKDRSAAVFGRAQSQLPIQGSPDKA